MAYSLEELNFESLIGGQGTIDNTRAVPVIDLSDFDSRREEIKAELWQAATKVGFFQIVNHGISLADIDEAFAQARKFFDQDNDVKSAVQLENGQNAGWEYKNQIRPSTGTVDQKESYQVTLPNMTKAWPDVTVLPQFKTRLLTMEFQAWQLGMKLLSCFAEILDMPRDFFTQAHDRRSAGYQSTLRLLHYLPLPEDYMPNPDLWRAGAHTDFDCLTMVFQREGEGGLQLCSGWEATKQQIWTDVPACEERITCNIGDMLMRWSDDRLKSTLHRVTMPNEAGFHPARYSMAFFCQANKEQVINGKLGKYEAISCESYLQQRIAANFEVVKP